MEMAMLSTTQYICLVIKSLVSMRQDMSQDVTFPSLPWSRQPATAVEAIFSQLFLQLFLDFFPFFLWLFPSMIWCLLATAVNKPSICQTQPKQLQILRRQCCLHCSESINFTLFSSVFFIIKFPDFSYPCFDANLPLQWKRHTKRRWLWLLQLCLLMSL